MPDAKGCSRVVVIKEYLTGVAAGAAAGDTVTGNGVSTTGVVGSIAAVLAGAGALPPHARTNRMAIKNVTWKMWRKVARTLGGIAPLLRLATLMAASPCAR